jgi:hypothetical protein
MAVPSTTCPCLLKDFSSSVTSAVAVICVVAEVLVHGVGKASGVEIEQRFVHVYELHDELIVWAGIFLTREEALEAAGLRE